MPFGSRLLLRPLGRIRSIVLIICRWIRIRLGIFRENVFRLLGAGSKQHLLQASQGDIFVPEQLQQFTMRRDQQVHDLTIATLPRLSPGTLLKFLQIVDVQLDDLWFRF
jgi:hypothetical protein